MTTRRTSLLARKALPVVALGFAAAGASAQFAGFVGPTLTSLGDNARGVVLGDFDSDGDLDIAATRSTDNTFDDVAILLNDGAGSFGAPTFRGVGAEPSKIEAADLDKDGDIDLVVANPDSNDVSVLRGNGDGTFAPELILSGALGVGTSPNDVAIGDFNNDDNLDIAVANSADDTITTILGDGAGGFAAGVVFATTSLDLVRGQNPSGIVAADLNKDGFDDIAAANSGSNDIGIYYNTGSGTFFTGDFALFTTLAVTPDDLEAGDLNKDGNPDLVASTVGAATTIAILLSDGAASFPNFPLSSTPAVGGSRPLDLAIGDVNKDGDPDIVTANQDSSNVSVLLGNGTGAFAAAANSPFGAVQRPSDMRLGDVDGDGDLDVVTVAITDTNAAILFNSESMIGGVPPVAQLIDPSPRQCVAGVFEITGVADVPGGVFGSYTLDFQNASTGGAFQLIASSNTPVPAPGGTLAMWDVSLIGEGFFLLRLRVENAMGLDEVETVLVHISQDFNRVEFFPARNGVPPSPVSIVGGRSCIFGFVNDNNCGPNTYTVDFRPVGGGAFTPVDPSNPVFMGDRLNETLANWDTSALGLPDGDYELRVEGMNGAGQSKVAPIQVVTVDNTPPTAEMNAPLNCSRFQLGSVIEIKGEIDDANLAGWTLQYSDGDADQWVTIASGNSPVSGVIANWDTTGLRPCAYTLRLIVTDKASVNCSTGHRVDRLTNVLVQCGADVDGDGTTGPSDLLALLASFGVSCPAP